MYSRITGVGACLPERIVTNAELEQRVDTTDAWIRARTGIAQRHVAAADETTCDLAAKAARRALAASGRTAAEVDLILVATTTPDVIFPSTACLLQQRLGASGCPAFDIQAVCAGFIYALSVVDQFIKSGGAKCALVVGAETMTRLLDWTDRSTCVLFGDGAGAVLVEADNKPGILSTHIHADGRYQALLNVPAGISSNYDQVKAGRAFITMQGNEVFKVAVNTLGRIVEQTLAANAMQKEELDWLVPHQANIRIITATAKKLDIPMNRVVLTIAEHGNTSAASVPLALEVAVRDGRIRAGETLLLEAFGGGFTWGSVLLKY